MFKKIFDLDPKDVENFIKTRILNISKRNLDEDFLYDEKDKTIKVEWYPVDDEFYVHLEMAIGWNNEKHTYVDKDGNIPTLEQYLNVKSNHWHFTFQEIYGLMTGETTYICDVQSLDFDKMMDFIFKKEYVSVVMKDNKWFLYDYDDILEKEIFSECPVDLIEEIKKTQKEGLNE